MGFLQRFMYGRYGIDQLSSAMLAAAIALNIVYAFVLVYPLRLISLVLFILCIYRMLSRNIDRRRRENTKFLNIFKPVISAIKMRMTIMSDKNHCYFKCPGCKKYLRVPRGKGKIHVTCRNCGTSFEQKS